MIGPFKTSSDAERVSSGTSITNEQGTWESSEGIEILLPSGTTDEHEHLDRERRHGWEKIKQLPRIEESEDVRQIVGDGERVPASGEYDLIIGDNPNGPGEVILKSDGQWVVLSATQPMDRYPDEPATPYEPVLPPEAWDHIQNENRPEITQELLHRIIEESEGQYGPDQVLKRGPLTKEGFRNGFG